MADQKGTKVNLKQLYSAAMAALRMELYERGALLSGATRALWDGPNPAVPAWHQAAMQKAFETAREGLGEAGFDALAQVPHSMSIFGRKCATTPRHNPAPPRAARLCILSKLRGMCDLGKACS